MRATAIRQRKERGWRWIPLPLLLGLLLPCASAQSPSGGGFVLRKQALNAGTDAASMALILKSTLAEPGSGFSSAEGYRLIAGFQTPRGQQTSDDLFSNGFE